MNNRDIVRWRKLSLGLGKSKLPGLDSAALNVVSKSLFRYFAEIRDINPSRVTDWYNDPHRLNRRTIMFLRSSAELSSGVDADKNPILTHVGFAVDSAIKLGFAIVVAPLREEDMPDPAYTVKDIQHTCGKPVPEMVMNFFPQMTFHIPEDDRVLNVHQANAEMWRLANTQTELDQDVDFGIMA